MRYSTCVVIVPPPSLTACSTFFLTGGSIRLIDFDMCPPVLQGSASEVRQRAPTPRGPAPRGRGPEPRGGRLPAGGVQRLDGLVRRHADDGLPGALGEEL